MKINQISVFLENRKGQLSEIGKTLKDAGVDIKALNMAEAAEYGIVRLVVTDAEKTADILKDAGYIAKVTEVVAAAVPDTTGGMYQMLEVLAKEDINIEYMYSLLGQHEGLAYMIIKVDDADKLEAVLKANGF